MRDRLSPKMKKLVAEMRDILKEKGLPVTAETVDLDPEEIKVWQPVSPVTVNFIAKRLSPNRGWPDDMPVIVVAKDRDGTYELIDGNHRRVAAIKKKFAKIPAISIAVETMEYMMRSGLDPDQMFEVIALESSAMEENQKLRDLEGNL